MTRKTLLVALLILSPVPASAQSQSQLVERYTTLAGSKDNATSLVTGLRDGTEVTLTRGTTTETFTPPTGKMGYGNIDHALALAEASLAKRGVEDPTLAQLETAVLEVLKMRADGLGWGRIAQDLGFKLGDVKRSDRAPERVAIERPNRPEKPERPEKPQRPERPERPERSR
jgi:hypothetical protein